MDCSDITDAINDVARALLAKLTVGEGPLDSGPARIASVRTRFSRRALEAVHADWPARKRLLSEPRGLELGIGRRPVCDRGQSQQRPISSAYSCRLVGEPA